MLFPNAQKEMQKRISGKILFCTVMITVLSHFGIFHRFFPMLSVQPVYASEAALQEASSDPVFYTHDGHVTFIDGAVTDQSISDFDDASQVLDAVLDQLGGDAQTQLHPWRTLQDASGNRYYVFQQMQDHTTVLGGAVKVITDPAGTMLALTSSIVSDLPKAEPKPAISAGEAEQIVIDHGKKSGLGVLKPMQDLTDRMILPVALTLDIDADDAEQEGARYVWVIYTENPRSSKEKGTLPYLAHYVTLSGEYLYSLPTIMPGDESGSTGFDASYVFAFMEPAAYTGQVTLSTGEEMSVSVDVMRDQRTGMYYLGNLERRIVVADCWEFLYDDNQVMLEYSPDNQSWDQTGLLTLYNYCRAYDYYKAIGWSGADGLDTPILVLNNYCSVDHEPIDNACYVGAFVGWQVFLSSRANDFSQCIDVLAHEFTHCVTGSVMTYNAYKNDFGAINEAMSDIQGKTCEMMVGEMVSWEIGDHSLEAVRNMAHPHEMQQPEYTWDLYYVPNVRTPTTLNDQGGVHSNSSLLNSVAYQLYETGGMTPEEGRLFWFTVDCAMVPGTDYPQLSELLPWALQVTGLTKYEACLTEAMSATHLGMEEIPDTFPDDRALITLYLPDQDPYNDDQWVLYLFNADLDMVSEISGTIFENVMGGDFSALPKPGDLLDLFQDGLQGKLKDWFHRTFSDAFFMASTNGGQDGTTMRIVSVPGYCLPVLMHGVYNDSTNALEDTSLLVYIGGQWEDISWGEETAGEETKPGIQRDETEPEALEPEGSNDLVKDLTEVLTNLFTQDAGIHDVLNLLFFRIDGSTKTELPNTGLDQMTPGTMTLGTNP